MSEQTWTLYVHTTPNLKHYVGITKHTANKRWKRGTGYKTQYFSKAIKKYGWENIRHDILATGLTFEEANALEIKIIAILKSNNKYHGYNLTDGGDGTKGLEISHEEKEKRRQRMLEHNPFKGKHHSEEAKQKMRESHYDCSGENNSFYGKHHTEETKKKLSLMKTGKHIPGHKDTPEQIERKRKLKSKPVNMYDMDMNYLATFPSALEAEKQTGCDHSLISRVCRGKLKSIHGFKWEYVA